MSAGARVFVVDDEPAVRKGLDRLLRAANLEVKVFASAQEFLMALDDEQPGCVILDMSMPGMSGLEVQRRFAAERSEMPIIVITGCGDVPMAVQAMKAGAAEFLTKPFGEQALLAAVRCAIERSEASLRAQEKSRAVREAYARLTPREVQVMAGLVSGLLNKQVGAELEISEITVKAHRGSIMRKMKADSFAGLVKMASELAT